MSTTVELLIKPRKGWQAIDLPEVWRFRELFGFLIWRDIKVRYKQTVFGALWAILQPLATMLVFTLILHRMAGVTSDGPPYPLFTFAGLVAWTFFANSVNASSNSLIGNQNLVAKIYFPRIFMPLATIGALLMDLLLSFGILAALMVYYRWPLTWSVLWLPAFVLCAFLAAGGLGLMLSALNVSFRDIKYLVPFCVQLGLFMTPVMYPIRYIPERFRILAGINPMTGAVLGFRYALLGSHPIWKLFAISGAVSVALFLVGLFIFRRMERRFADII